MNQFIKLLKEHLAKNPPNYGEETAHSLLEMLYEYYIEQNPASNQTMQDCFQALDVHLAPLPLAVQNEVFHLVCTIYSENQRLAFLDGVRVGARLRDELSD